MNGDAKERCRSERSEESLIIFADTSVAIEDVSLRST